MNETYLWSLVGTLASAAFLLLVGCESSLEPFSENKGLYSIYGFLNLSEGQHFIRVKNLNDPMVAGSTRVLDATVTLENLNSGTVEMLADSIAGFDGIYTHNFRTDQEIQPGATYQVTVERPDGRTSQASATMPPRTKLEVEPAKSDTLSCTQGIQFNFRNVPEPRLLRMSIAAYWKGWRRVEKDIAPRDGFVPWKIVTEFVPERTLSMLPGPSHYCTLLGKNKLRITYTHFGPDWPTDSVLANPTASTVKNGLGVFGGVHQDTLVRFVHTKGPS